MSPTRTGFLILTIIAAASIAFVVGMRLSSAPPAAPATKAQPAAQNPLGVVTVSAHAQEQSGLATAAVEATVFHPAADTYAVALDIRPLLAARQQIATAKAQVQAAEAAERASHAEYERARKLFADDRNVSQKAMQAAEAVWRGDQGKLEAATASLHESEAAAEQQFGRALAGGGAMSSAELRHILSREGGLIQVIIPPSTADAPGEVSLSAPGYPTSRAHVIGPAQQVKGTAGVRAFLYRSKAVYPSGLRLSAEVPLSHTGVSGFVVPESAVIWYANEPWVFVQAAPERFVRKALVAPQAAAGGVFTTTSFAAGERIVTRGAQLLQSEALKPTTPATTGCSDPECDD